MHVCLCGAGRGGEVIGFDWLEKTFKVTLFRVFFHLSFLMFSCENVDVDVVCQMCNLNDNFL